MQPFLAEAAGGEVLEEIALDRMLEEELAREGIALTAADIQREETLLLDSLIQADVADDERQSRALLSDLRARRGLGEHRYSALLRRSAALRALVQDQIVLTDEVVRQTHELLHGARYDIRLIVVPNDPTLDAVAARLERGEPFAEVAARFSTHESANRGGLVQSLSVADPSLPTAVREAVRPMAPGERSDAIALTTGYAFVLVEDVQPGDGLTLEMVRPEVELEARRTQERLRMSDLAGNLLTRANVIVFDQALNESWSAQTPVRR